jgi:hypothetical protein
MGGVNSIFCNYVAANLVTRARHERPETLERKIFHWDNLLQPSCEIVHLGSGILQPLNSGSERLPVSIPICTRFLISSLEKYTV